jgi:hypothetical protein
MYGTRRTVCRYRNGRHVVIQSEHLGGNAGCKGGDVKHQGMLRQLVYGQQAKVAIRRLVGISWLIGESHTK